MYVLSDRIKRKKRKKKKIQKRSRGPNYVILESLYVLYES